MNHKGFTLTELLVVLTIISILAMIGIPAYIGQQSKASRTEAYKNLEALRLFEEQFIAENANYTVPAANIAAIQNILPGFQPGTSTEFRTLFQAILDRQYDRCEQCLKGAC